MARQSLDGWIREQLTDPEKGRPSRFSIVHQRGDRQQEVYTAPAIPDKGNVDERELATVLYNKAESYCQALPGVHTFVVLCFWKTPEPGASHAIVIKGKLDYEGATEEPNEQGERMQRMRHRETNHLYGMQRQQQLDAYSLAIIDRLGSLLRDSGDRELRARRNESEMFEVTRQILLDRIKENNEHELAKLKLQSQMAERKRLLEMAPPLANTILGREVFPQEYADKKLIDQIADSLPADALQKIAALGIFPPELVAVLATRFEKRIDELEQEKKNAEKLAPKIERPALMQGEPAEGGE